MADWVRELPGGCALTVRVTPRASRPGVRATEAAVFVRVQAPPAEGRATAEAAARMAEALGVAKSAVRLLRGAAARTKTFEVSGLSAKEAGARLLGA